MLYKLAIGWLAVSGISAAAIIWNWITHATCEATAEPEDYVDRSAAPAVSADTPCTPSWARAVNLEDYPEPPLPPGVPIFEFPLLRHPTDEPPGCMRYRCVCGNAEHSVQLSSWWDGIMSWTCPVCHSHTHGAVFTSRLRYARQGILEVTSKQAELS